MSTETGLTQADEQAPEPLHEGRAVAPLVDIYESPDEILLIADMPGVIPDALALHLEEGELRLEGRRAHAATGTPLATGYELFDYERTFRLPKNVDTSRIDAKLVNGLLSLHLPKREELKPRRIEVRTI